MDRIEYMKELAYALTDEECWRMFHVFKAALEDGTAKWNEALEYAYNEFMSDMEDFD